MATTINGKSYAEIGKLLKAPFDEATAKRRDDNNSVYFPVEVFKDRLDDVVGVMNYDYEVKSITRIESVGSGKKNIIEAQVALTIKNDDGIPVKRCEGVGATPMIIVSATGNEKNPNSDVIRAEQNAFKHLCQNVFGMGAAQLSEMNDFGKGKRNNGNGNRPVESSNANAATLQGLPQGVVAEHLKITGNFVRRGEHIYGKAETKHCKSCDVVIFKKQQDAISKRMSLDTFIATYTVGKELTMYGTYGEYQGKVQFRFHPKED